MHDHRKPVLLRLAGWTITLIIMLGCATVSTSTQSTTPNVTANLTALQIVIRLLRANVTEINVDKDQTVDLEVGDKIQVDQGGRGILRFGDRLRVELFRDTELQFSDIKLESGDSMFLRLKQVFGHTRTTLSEQANAHVKIETDFAVITSLVGGSDILLCHDPSVLTCMVVVDGEVEVSAQDQTLNVKGGEATYILPDQPPSPPICVHEDELNQWLSLKRAGADVEPLGALVARWDGQPCPSSDGRLVGQETVQPTPDLESTQMADSVLATQNPEPVNPQPVLASPTPPQELPSVDLDAMMKSARILLYEDMVNDPTEYRYTRRTLDSMGLSYKDDGSAKGWLKTDLLGGAPDGNPWDLVILAIEYRGQITGEYFDYLNDVLNQGTSVILEAWHLDQISKGSIAPILNRCGVQVSQYKPSTGGSIDAVVWPISGASHPVLSDPNAGLSFTKARQKWISSGDLGDLMQLTGSGDAQLLLGTNASNASSKGVLGVCLGGQLTLQTFSSHSFPYETMHPLWENMIYNALKVRLLGGS